MDILEEIKKIEKEAEQAIFKAEEEAKKAIFLKEEKMRKRLEGLDKELAFKVDEIYKMAEGEIRRIEVAEKGKQKKEIERLKAVKKDKAIEFILARIFLE